MKNKRIIVDENDNPIGAKSSEEMNYSKDIYRVTAIWVTNSKGEVLIAQRSFNKTDSPGKWSGAVAGTVDEGETYDSNAYKELEEEIGITGVSLTPFFKHYVDGYRKYFGQWYSCTLDKPAEDFVIQKDEVEGVKWISPEELKMDVEKNPEKYVPSFPKSLKKLLP
jgi:isopentenyldiphosphate isomerase